MRVFVLLEFKMFQYGLRQERNQAGDVRRIDPLQQPYFTIFCEILFIIFVLYASP